jgi:hypothetical protein
VKTLILTICATVAATSAVAGEVVEVPATGSGDGALILLALLGVVIASSAIGGAATRNATTMDIDPTDIDEN